MGLKGTVFALSLCGVFSPGGVFGVFCGVFAISLRDLCSVFARSLRCLCYVFARSLRCLCNNFAWPLRCLCQIWVGGGGAVFLWCNLRCLCNIFMMSLRDLCGVFAWSLRYLCQIFAVYLTKKTAKVLKKYQNSDRFSIAFPIRQYLIIQIFPAGADLSACGGSLI